MLGTNKLPNEFYIKHKCNYKTHCARNCTTLDWPIRWVLIQKEEAHKSQLFNEEEEKNRNQYMHEAFRTVWMSSKRISLMAQNPQFVDCFVSMPCEVECHHLLKRIDAISAFNYK